MVYVAANSRKIPFCVTKAICENMAKDLGQCDAPCWHINRAVFHVMNVENAFIEACLVSLLPEDTRELYHIFVAKDLNYGLEKERFRLACEKYCKETSLYIRTVQLVCEFTKPDDFIHDYEERYAKGEVVCEICQNGAVEYVVVRCLGNGTMNWYMVPKNSVNYDIKR